MSLRKRRSVQSAVDGWRRMLSHGRLQVLVIAFPLISEKHGYNWELWADETLGPSAQGVTGPNLPSMRVRS
jgi:hypothetical protein